MTNCRNSLIYCRIRPFDVAMLNARSVKRIDWSRWPIYHWTCLLGFWVNRTWLVNNDHELMLRWRRWLMVPSAYGRRTRHFFDCWWNFQVNFSNNWLMDSIWMEAKSMSSNRTGFSTEGRWQIGSCGAWFKHGIAMATFLWKPIQNNRTKKQLSLDVYIYIFFWLLFLVTCSAWTLWRGALLINCVTAMAPPCYLKASVDNGAFERVGTCKL